MANPTPEEWYKLGPFTVFDLETTGLSPIYDRVIEIAAIKIDADSNRTKFHSLVNPGRKIPSSVSKIHGITSDSIKNAENFEIVGKKFLEFIKDSTLVAHNARFDLAFLQESFARENLELWNGKTLDTIPLVRNAYPGLQSYSLQNLIYTLSLDSKVGPAHRAYADVEWTLEIFAMTMKKLLS